MVPRYKHAIKHEMRLVLLAKLPLSECVCWGKSVGNDDGLIVIDIDTDVSGEFAVPWSTWRAETCQDNPSLVTQFLAGYTDGNPDAKDSRLTL